MAGDLGRLREAKRLTIEQIVFDHQEKGLGIRQIVFSGTCELDGETHHVMGFTCPSEWAEQRCLVRWHIGQTILEPFPVQEPLPPTIDHLLWTFPDPDELGRRYRAERLRQSGSPKQQA